MAEAQARRRCVHGGRQQAGEPADQAGERQRRDDAAGDLARGSVGEPYGANPSALALETGHVVSRMDRVRREAPHQPIDDRAVAGSRVEERAVEMRRRALASEHLGERGAEREPGETSRRYVGVELACRQAPELLRVAQQERLAEAPAVEVEGAILEAPLRARPETRHREVDERADRLDGATPAQPVERSRREVDEAPAVVDLARRVHRDQLVAEQSAHVGGDVGVAGVKAMRARVVAVRAERICPTQSAARVPAFEQAERHIRMVRVVRHRDAGGPAAEDREVRRRARGCCHRADSIGERRCRQPRGLGELA